ncbi:MAG: DUF4345 family protein [bacterium]|jgi:hypothetical protein|nr:DUF4345 domain-containing protein [Gammaproteobacteria bacterium]
MNYVKPYLIFMCLVWLPWGLICIFDTGGIADIIGVTSLNATGTTDLRVMYGGFQFAVGLMAARALFDQRYFANFVYALAFLASCMALSRGYGLVVDGSTTIYTWGVLGFEAFAGVTGILWLRTLSRQE